MPKICDNLNRSHAFAADSSVFKQALSTVEGAPEIDDIKAMLLEKKIKKASLMLFISVAGNRARNDMAGDEDDSWKSMLINHSGLGRGDGVK